MNTESEERLERSDDYGERLKQIPCDNNALEQLIPLAIEVMNESNETEFIDAADKHFGPFIVAAGYALYLRSVLVLIASSDRLFWMLRGGELYSIELAHVLHNRKERLRHVIRIIIGDYGWECYKNFLMCVHRGEQYDRLDSNTQHLYITTVLSAIKEEYELDVNKLLENEPDNKTFRLVLSQLYPEEV